MRADTSAFTLDELGVKGVNVIAKRSLEIEMKQIVYLLMILAFAVASGSAQDNSSAPVQPTPAVSANPTDPAGQVRLGMKYALQYPRDTKSAMIWFKKAADQGYADGQYRLGGMYDVAVSPQNPTEAIKWYTLAANQGYKDAQYRLAVMYDQGRGTTKDYTEAAKWYEKAGTQGRPEAQYRLGEMFEKGQGVPQNYKLAMKWYQAAALQGRPEAEYKVGYLYEQGLGTPRNNNEAIAWYKKADKDGYPDARDALKALDSK